MPDYTALSFPSAPPDRPYVVLNMVASVDGRAVVDGSEAGLGSDTDRRLMRELRTYPDAILVGAGTLRATGASPRPGTPALVALREARGLAPQAIAAVLSGSGDLPLDRAFFHADDFDAIVYLGDRAEPERRRRLEATGRTVVDVPQADPVPEVLRHLFIQRGCRLLLLEGGPGLNALFFAADVIDEVFLTIGPVIVGGDGAQVVGTALERAVRPLSLLSAIPEPLTGEVFLRYRRARGTP